MRSNKCPIALLLFVLLSVFYTFIFISLVQFYVLLLCFALSLQMVTTIKMLFWSINFINTVFAIYIFYIVLSFGEKCIVP